MVSLQYRFLPKKIVPKNIYSGQHVYHLFLLEVGPVGEWAVGGILMIILLSLSSRSWKDDKVIADYKLPFFIICRYIVQWVKGLCDAVSFTMNLATVDLVDKKRESVICQPGSATIANQFMLVAFVCTYLNFFLLFKWIK